MKRTKSSWPELKQALRRHFKLMDQSEKRFPEEFSELIAPLSVRTKNILFNAGVLDRRALLSLTFEGLLKLRNCGKKTAEEILALQRSLTHSDGQ